jgi:hypothetical protein
LQSNSLADHSETLIDLALGAQDPIQRREAFLSLLRSDEWRSVLAPHVVAHQGIASKVGAVLPDPMTFRAAASIVAQDDEKVQRSLELAGSRFGDVLLHALAQEMGSSLVESALSHLRTARGTRRSLLQRVLFDADPVWVKQSQATQIVRRQLREVDQDRSELLLALARAGNMSDFIEVLHKQPPVSLEEWGALGRSALFDETLYALAMATLPRTPSPLAYLLRLDPVPPEVVQRLMASARGEWVAAALEAAVVDGVRSPSLIPLAELGVRLGGRSLAVATAWITSSNLAVELLEMLKHRLRGDERSESIETLRLAYSPPSADRALEQGRRGEPPDLFDAAALVRQLRGRKLRNMVREILREPRPALVETVLRPLCAVSSEAAQEVIELTNADDPELAARAQDARAWPDILWPFVDDPTQELQVRSD